MIRKIPIALLCIAAILPAASLDRRIADAAQHGDHDAVRALIQQKADVNGSQGDGMTALHWAAFNDDVETARLLLAAGADWNTMTRNGSLTPLLLACVNGDPAMIEALLNAGADPNSAKSDGATALMAAATSGNPQAIKVLMDHGANINATEKVHGQSAVMFAAALNRPGAIRMLASRGAALNASTRVEKLESQKLDDNGNPLPKADETVNGGNTTMGGMTALLFSARDGALDAVKALVESGADVNQLCAGDKSSPLVIAVSNGHYEVGKYLVEHGGNPNLANVDGLTPLYAAIDMQYAPVSWAPNPLTVQEKVTYLELMTVLLDRGADPNAKIARKLWFRPTSHNQQWISTVGSTAFWRAAQAADVPAMKLLVAHGADPKIATTGGTTPLMVASGLGFAGNFSQTAAEGWLPAAKYCLQLGLDINATDGQGYTALHGAAYVGDNELVTYLVDHGAKLDARNRMGWSVTDMANAPSLRSSVPVAHPETIALLVKMGAPPLTAIEGETILGSGRRERARIAAAEKAKTPEGQFQNAMKDISSASGRLKKSVPGGAHDEIATDAQHLDEVFKGVEAYLAGQRVEDAVKMAQSMRAAASELSAAAAAHNTDGENAALQKINAGCASCHAAHREKLPDGGYKFKK
jgi:ankyrin repeat protein